MYERVSCLLSPDAQSDFSRTFPIKSTNGHCTCETSRQYTSLLQHFQMRLSGLTRYNQNQAILRAEPKFSTTPLQSRSANLH